MIFHEIDMKGKFWLEELSITEYVKAVDNFSSDDRGRLLSVYQPLGLNYISYPLVVGGVEGWEIVTTGGNDAYISATDADSHAGTITPTVDNTIDLGSGAARYANIYGVSFQGTTTTATYADLAEKYTMDKEYPVGTLLTITPDLEFEMGECTSGWQIVTGVISDKPGFILNADSVGQPVALVGKTPIRVIGSIEKGDYLCSNGDGTAVRTSGSMMAIALETNEDEEEKLVMCLLKL